MIGAKKTLIGKTNQGSLLWKAQKSEPSSDVY